MNILNKPFFKIIRRIIFICIVIVFILAVGVKASKSSINTVKIVFDDDCEITVMTKEIEVAKILEENHIILNSNEKVYPNLECNIDVTKIITISKEEIVPIVISEEVQDVTTEEILGKYVTTTEKIVVEQVEIPYETITKDISNSAEETTDKILQYGKNGIKEIKYKIKLQNDEEIERVVISETVIKEPVDKIVQISRKIVSRGSIARYSSEDIAASVAGKTPKEVTLNTSAYCAASCGGNTRTACGAIADTWYTIAAGKSYPIGTIIYVPYFKDKPNKGWFVVQDRGGAITDNRLDVWMGSLTECISFGRRNLTCYIYE